MRWVLHGNTSNALKYLELGVLQLRYEIMKRKLNFLQYLLKEGNDIQNFESHPRKPLEKLFCVNLQKVHANTEEPF